MKHKLIAHNGSIQVILGAYNSGKPGKLREFFNSGKLREI